MKKKTSIGACGYFDEERTIANGQTLRTRAVTSQLKKELGEEAVRTLDYSSWRRRPLSLLFSFLKLVRESEKLMLFPDENAVRVLAPLAVFLGKLYSTEVYYTVIGGWLPRFLPKHKAVLRALKRFDGLFVQTQTLKDGLTEQGLEKVYVFPNFRVSATGEWKKSPLEAREGKLKLCFLSRVEEPKGVSEMIETVERVNRENERCTLMIFGPVQNGYEEAFEAQKAAFPSYIQYGGALKSAEINGILCDYDVQLFPTKYRTEGFPGSVLDSFYAGVPVLAAQWDSARELIRDREDGLLFDFGDYADMETKLNELLDDPAFLRKLKEGCRKRGDEYDAGKITGQCLSVLFSEAEEGTAK